MADETAPTAPTPDFKLVPVKWPLDPGPAIYANNLCVQFDGASILLTFAQVNPPLAVGKDDDETKGLQDSITSVTATPVVRVIVPLPNFHVMLAMIQQNMEKIEKIVK